MNDRMQQRIGKWVRKVFGDKIFFDRHERALRILEEAMELAQVEGVAETQASMLAARTWSRPVGELRQEVAGIGVTLLAYAEAVGISAADEVQGEMRRVSSQTVIRQIQEKQKEKTALGLTSYLKGDY